MMEWVMRGPNRGEAFPLEAKECPPEDVGVSRHLKDL